MAMKVKTGEDGLKNLDEYKSTAEFLSSCKSKATYASYKSSINHFIRFTGSQTGTVIDPDTLVTLDLKKINQLMLDWMIHLKKNAKNDFGYRLGEVHANSVANYCNRVKQWLTYHDIILSWKKIERFIPEPMERNWHIYTIDEVKKMLKLASPRERLMILILATSGMRVAGMIGLKIQDYTELQNGLGMFKVYSGSPRWYPTFCTQECVAAIRFYLKWREEMGETMTRDAPLIRDAVRERLSRAVKRPHHITVNRAWFIMRRLGQKASIPMANLQPDHSFRKLMNTAVANRKMNPMFREIIMGHSPKLDKIYFDKSNPDSIEALFEEYARVSNKLIFNEEYRLKDEVVELQARLKDAPKLEIIQQSLVAKELEMNAMKKWLEEEREERQQLYEELFKQGVLKKKVV